MSGKIIYIGGLHYDARERDLERFFRGYGRIEDINIKSGYAFVVFEDDLDADDAVNELDGKKILGRRVTVQLATSQPQGYDLARYGYDKDMVTRTEHQLLVKNLSHRVGWRYLRDFLSQYAEVTYADCHKTAPNQGVVDFATREDLKYVLRKCNGAKLDGRTLQISVYNKSRSRSKSSDDSRSQDRSLAAKKERRVRSLSRDLSRSPSRERKRKRSRSNDKSKKRMRSSAKAAGAANSSSDNNRDESSSKRERSSSVTRFLSSRTVKTGKR